VLADTYNITSITEENCTYPSLPLPPMLGVQYACTSAPDNGTRYIEEFLQYDP